MADGDEISFGRGPDDPKLNRGPSPLLCNLHYAVSKVLGMGGAADVIAQWKDDADDSDFPHVYLSCLNRLLQHFVGKIAAELGVGSCIRVWYYIPQSTKFYLIDQISSVWSVSDTSCMIKNQIRHLWAHRITLLVSLFQTQCCDSQFIFAAVLFGRCCPICRLKF